MDILLTSLFFFSLPLGWFSLWYSYLPLGWVRTLRWFYLLFAPSQSSLEGFPSHPVIKSKLILPTAQQANKSKRRGVEARNVALFREPADQEDGRIMCLNNHLIGVWMPVSFTELRGKGSEAVKPHSIAMSLCKHQGTLKDREAWSATVHWVTKSWTPLSDWTTTILQSRRGCVNFFFSAAIYRWAESDCISVPWTKAL